jgi:hypothetical protein
MAFEHGEMQGQRLMARMMLARMVQAAKTELANQEDQLADLEGQPADLEGQHTDRLQWRTCQPPRISMRPSRACPQISMLCEFRRTGGPD